MKKPLLLMLHLVVPWLCLTSSATLLRASETADAAVLRDYPQVKFSIATATPETYNSFIASVRAALVSKAKGKSNGIPVLLSENDPLALQTFLNITMVNKAGHSISLKMDVTGAYFTAYVAGNYSCLIKSATCFTDPWSSSVATTLLQSSSSSNPAGGGGVAGGDGDFDLEAATWRVQDLDEAISSLFLFAGGKAKEQDFRRGVATCDMMIASAAKFPYVQRRVSAGMRDGNGVSGDDPSLHALQARWPALSSAVQESFQGAFAAPVTVRRSNGETLRVDSVRRAVPLVSFLEHDECGKKKAAPAQLSMIIRSVVPEAAAGMAVAPATACGSAEPTTRIVGPEGRCLDVPYNWYYSGNQVQLWPCKSYDDRNQLWTFKRDGTIRSGGKCLTAGSATAAGAGVVVDDCPPAPTDRVVWEARADGTIALKSGGGGLVLAVTSSAAFAPVTVRRDDRGTGQSWTPTNDTAPMAAAIVGYGDLCLQVDFAGAVSLASCGGGGGGAMEWSLYPDGSVRPPAWLLLQWRCLAADASGRVTVKYCYGAGSACERWVFRSDGTILNAGTGKVLDVAPSASKRGRYDVVVAPPATGRATQQWAVML